MSKFCKMCGRNTAVGAEYCTEHEAQRMKIADALNYADFRELGLKRLITLHRAITKRSEWAKVLEEC